MRLNSNGMGGSAVLVQPSCPNCAHPLSRAEQRRMSPFWKGTQSITCSTCGSTLDWHSSLRRRIQIGSILFKAGIGVVVLSIVVPSLFGLPRLAQPYAFIGGVALVVIGILATTTKPGSALVQARPGA